MRQNISVQQLTPGMKIVSLDIGWDKSPKWSGPFVLQSGEDLALLLQHCRIVTIENGQPEAAAAGTATQTETARQPMVAGAPVAEHFSRCLSVMKNNFDRLRYGQDLDEKSLFETTDTLMAASREQPQALLLLSELEQKDSSLERKSLDIAILALCFGHALGLPQQRLQQLGLSALLHDIGMVKMSDQLLKKGRNMSPAEKQQLHKHVSIGCNLLYKTKAFRPLIKTVAHHHERVDGKGYPAGIRGNAIPLEARILAIAAIYNTLTRQKNNSSHAASTQALRKLYTLRDRHIDSTLTVRFIRFMGIYPVGTLVELNAGQIGIVVDVHSNSRARPVVQCLYDKQGQALKSSAPIDLADQRYQHLQVTASVKAQHLSQFSGRDLAAVVGVARAA